MMLQRTKLLNACRNAVDKEMYGGMPGSHRRTYDMRLVRRGSRSSLFVIATLHYKSATCLDVIFLVGREFVL